MGEDGEAEALGRTWSVERSLHRKISADNQFAKLLARLRDPFDKPMTPLLTMALTGSRLQRWQDVLEGAVNTVAEATHFTAKMLLAEMYQGVAGLSVGSTIRRFMRPRRPSL